MRLQDKGEKLKLTEEELQTTLSLLEQKKFDLALKTERIMVMMKGFLNREI